MLWNKISSQQPYVYLSTENTLGTTTGEHATSVVAVTQFPTEAVLHEAIQSALKQELSPYLNQFSSAAQVQQNLHSINPTDVKENSTENIQAFTGSMSVIETAIASGKWTNEDNIIISQYLPELTIAQSNTLREKVFRSIHLQELQPVAVPIF